MSSLKKELFNGIAYTALLKYSNILISLVVTAVLSRIISPDDFGVVAVATVIIAFFSLFTEVGLSPAIVQHKNLSKKQLSDIFSFTVLVGIFLSVSFFFSAHFIANYYQQPALNPICKILSVNILFASFNIVPNALLYRDKLFRYIAVRGLAVQIVGGIVGILVAWMGGGLYALVVNPILSSIFLFLISYRRYPLKFQTKWKVSSLQAIFSYSAYQFSFNIINYFSRNLDTLLIGKYMNMNALGYYDKSYRLMTLPLQTITQVVTPVMHPLLSDFQQDKQRLGESHERIVRILASIGFPLSVFLYFSSKEIIILLFGAQWMPSVPVFQILSLSVGVQMVLSSSGSIFQAAGDTRSLFVSGLFSAATNIIGILLGIFYFQSLTAVASAICITFALNFFQCYLQMYLITLKRNIWNFFRTIFPAIIFSILLLTSFTALNSLFIEFSLFASLILKMSLFAFLFGGYFQFFLRKYINS